MSKTKPEVLLGILYTKRFPYTLIFKLGTTIHLVHKGHTYDKVLRLKTNFLIIRVFQESVNGKVISFHILLDVTKIV